METMRRGLLLLAGLGILTLVGCGSTRPAMRGECDCQVYPIGTGTPPAVKALPLGDI
jgi:hypothetical protein